MVKDNTIFILSTDIQDALELDISEGRIHRNGWHDNATGDGVLGYKLIIQTGDSGKRTNKDRVG